MSDLIITLVGFSFIQWILWWWFDFRMHRSLRNFLKQIFGDDDF